MLVPFLNSPISLIEDGDTLALEVHCDAGVTHDEATCYWVGFLSEPLTADHAVD